MGADRAEHVATAGQSAPTGVGRVAAELLHLAELDSSSSRPGAATSCQTSMIAATPRSPSCPTSLRPRPGPRCASRSASSARPPSPSPRRSPTTAARWRPPHAAAPPRGATRPPASTPAGSSTARRSGSTGRTGCPPPCRRSADRRRGPPSGPSRSRRVARRRRSPHRRSRSARPREGHRLQDQFPAGAQEPPSQSDDRRAAREPAATRSRDGPHGLAMDLFDPTQNLLGAAMRGAAARQTRWPRTSPTRTRPATSASTSTSTARWRRRLGDGEAALETRRASPPEVDGAAPVRADGCTVDVDAESAKLAATRSSTRRRVGRPERASRSSQSAMGVR